jgi:hypothetical protein
MRPTVTLLCLLLVTLVSASQTLLNVSTVTASSNTSQGNSYQSFRCQTGAEKPDAVINCLAVLAQMRSTPTDPRSFDFKRWQDEPNGCAITAIGVGEPRATIDARDLPNHLMFLLYRCFLTDRVTPSSSAMIFAGPLSFLSSGNQTSDTTKWFYQGRERRIICQNASFTFFGLCISTRRYQWSFKPCGPYALS